MIRAGTPLPTVPDPSHSDSGWKTKRRKVRLKLKETKRRKVRLKLKETKRRKVRLKLKKTKRRKVRLKLKKTKRRKVRLKLKGMNYFLIILKGNSVKITPSSSICCLCEEMFHKSVWCPNNVGGGGLRGTEQFGGT